MRRKAVAAFMLLSVSVLAFAFVIQPVNAQLDPDLNDDGKVDIEDVAIAASAFGSYPGHQRWSPEADMDENDRVDIKDLLSVARSFG